MKIENVRKGKCSFCDNKASVRLDGVSHCSACADSELIKQIGRCVKAVKFAKVTMKITPKRIKCEA